jgi:tetratricopeptide (TPR) repeat protein
MGQQLDSVWLLMPQNRFEQSEPKIREHLREFPDDVSGHLCLGLCLCDLGRYPEGIDAAHTALALEPNNALAHWLLGAINLRTQQLEQAEAYFLKTIALDPEQPSFYASLGELYWRQGSNHQEGTAARSEFWRQGIQAVMAGLAIHSEHQNCLEYLVRNLVATGDPDSLPRAIAVAEELLAIAPENAAAHAVYAHALLIEQYVRTQGRRPTRQDIERIMPIFQESLRLDPHQSAPKVHAYNLLTRYYRRWSSRWSMLFCWAVWPLLVLTVCLYQTSGLQGYPIGISAILCTIGLAYLGDVTDTRWKIRRHPHYRQFADPKSSDIVLEILWGLIAATLIVGLVWSWLPSWLIGLLLRLFQVSLALLGFLFFLRFRRFFFWWTNDPSSTGNVLRCLWGLSVVGVVVGLACPPVWLTGWLLRLSQIGLGLFGLFLLLARPWCFGVTPDKTE